MNGDTGNLLNLFSSWLFNRGKSLAYQPLNTVNTGKENKIWHLSNILSRTVKCDHHVTITITWRWSVTITWPSPSRDGEGWSSHDHQPRVSSSLRWNWLLKLWTACTVVLNCRSISECTILLHTICLVNLVYWIRNLIWQAHIVYIKTVSHIGYGLSVVTLVVATFVTLYFRWIYPRIPLRRYVENV